MFTGRPTPAPGEPLFTEDDTAAAIALAEEERDTCPACGMPKAWCRDPANGRAMFEAHDEFCWPTYYMTLRGEKVQSEAHNATFRATQISSRFREGREPDVEAGLDLERSESGQSKDDAADRKRSQKPHGDLDGFQSTR